MSRDVLDVCNSQRADSSGQVQAVYFQTIVCWSHVRDYQNFLLISDNFGNSCASTTQYLTRLVALLQWYLQYDTSVSLAAVHLRRTFCCQISCQLTGKGRVFHHKRYTQRRLGMFITTPKDLKQIIITILLVHQICFFFRAHYLHSWTEHYVELFTVKK